MRLTLIFLFLNLAVTAPAQKGIDPTFLRTSLSTAAEQKAHLTTRTCHYKPLFGEGAAHAHAAVGVARYGEAIVDAGGSCAVVNYPKEEQVYLVLSGSGSVLYGSQHVPVKKEDYLYLPPKAPHSLENRSGAPLRVLVMGFRTKPGTGAYPKSPAVANMEDVPLQAVGGHPLSSQYRLLMGDIHSKRDRIAAAQTLTSLFLMEIDPSGTNFPHHHPDAEEIYLILDGHGEQVAGGGTDGIAGRRPAKPGDAYFYRLAYDAPYTFGPAPLPTEALPAEASPAQTPGGDPSDAEPAQDRPAGA